MNTTRFQRTTRVLIAAMAVAGLALVLPAAAPAEAAGLRNCVDITGRQFDRVGCYELVWVDGVQYRMTFANTSFQGATPSENLGNFYVIGPQTDAPQSGTSPFVHDHTVAAVPRQSGGEYVVHHQGILVLCSEQGIVSGACVPTFSAGSIPLATTVNGQSLTSVEAIESVAAAGLVVLLEAGVIVGTISGN